MADLYDVARQVTDEVLGEGTYDEINSGNPDPGVRAAIRRGEMVLNEEGEPVEAAIFVGLQKEAILLRKFPMTRLGYREATEFIGTLEGHDDGRYYLDCPVPPRELPSRADRLY